MKKSKQDRITTPSNQPDSIALLWAAIEENFGDHRDIRITVSESMLRGGESGGWSVVVWLSPPDRRHRPYEATFGQGETREEAVTHALDSIPDWYHVLRRP